MRSFWKITFINPQKGMKLCSWEDFLVQAIPEVGIVAELQILSSGFFSQF